MAKVYLSSTLLDLKEERRAVSDWLLAAGFQPVHSYVADSETVRDSCLDDIEGCEFFVLIVGHRLGFQPEKGNSKKRSITQMEFSKARKLKLPCLAFLRTSVPDVALSDINDPGRYALVQAFRAEVQEKVRPAEFKDMAEFIAALSAAMMRHVMKLLEQRDAVSAGEQGITALETELQEVREGAVARVLEEAAQPRADDLAQRARAALLRGDSALAEQLLREQEDQAAAAAENKRREAAGLARQIASLAAGRDSRAALAALERAAAYLPDDFWTQIELGDARAIDGQSVAALGAYEVALSIAETLAARDPANTEWQRDLSVSHSRIGDVLRAQGDGAGALATYRKSLAIAETLAARDPANTEWQRDLSVSHSRIGDVLRAQGDGAGALAAYRNSLAIAEMLAARDPADTEWQRDLSVSNDRIGNVLRAQGDGAEALAAYRKGLAIAETLAARDPGNTEWQRDLLVSHGKIGNVLVGMDDGAGALAAYRRGLAIAETLAARDPANTQWQRDLSVSYNKIGDMLRVQGDDAGALAAYRKSLAIAEMLATRDPANTEWQRDLSVSHDKIGDMLSAQGDGAGALAAYRRSLAIAETLAARDPANIEWQRDLIVSYVKLSEASSDKAYVERALLIAEEMQARGVLAPVDTWMIDVLKRQVGQ